ncbi:hypothetical protein VCRA2123O444_10417 [Vibrio crassostreae]|nr:hypothetical protein VCRA2119O431_10050 [Vibrio crassostreae]CAK1822872.1 hypothetical protein VCRA2114O422_10050 [Vibrio crassostreae]CAK1825409.1 hypothetical protein VCRA2113O409_10050 [Vibrio crassostreae]CAK1829838.1 hypothetical protein VCRA2119O430_10050 [Vibrio crassostreae]CAK1834162.1 hypothetical protein VCRA2113O412_10050 [Vibrio crassostreae]
MSDFWLSQSSFYWGTFHVDGLATYYLHNNIILLVVIIFDMAEMLTIDGIILVRSINAK